MVQLTSPAGRRLFFLWGGRSRLGCTHRKRSRATSINCDVAKVNVADNEMGERMLACTRAHEEKSEIPMFPSLIRTEYGAVSGSFVVTPL